MTNSKINTNPSEDAQKTNILKYFDSEFYLSINPDVRESNLDPFEHFFEYGWQEGRSPNSRVDMAYYIQQRNLAQDTSIDFFFNFLKNQMESASSDIGYLQEDNDIKIELEPLEQKSQTYAEYEKVLVEKYFDAEFYIRTNTDVEVLGLDPLEHFLEYGWREGRNPSRDFDIKSYLEANTDVKQADINPYYHYLASGKSEGRMLRRMYSAERRIIDNAESMEVRAERYTQKQKYKEQISSSVLVDAICKDLVNNGTLKLIISISHDSYISNFGGVQNCIRDEQVFANNDGISYLHLSPTYPSLAFNRKNGEDYSLCVNYNGVNIGHCSGSTVLKSLGDSKLIKLKFYIQIHSLLGHNLSFLLRVYEDVNAQKIGFWVHDCSTLCSNYALLRNDVEFCWAPSIDSSSCSICVYGSERQSHLESIQYLFGQIKPFVYFPSKSIRDLWCAKSNYVVSGMSVISHGEMVFTNERTLKTKRDSINIAFIGMPASHKGWHVFSELAYLCKNDTSFRFYHFGTNSASSENITFIESSVNSEDRNLMVNRLIDNNIDVVVQWSLCYETFSFSTCEAILSGAFVVARCDSGNTPYLIQEHTCGKLLSEKHELFDYFQSGKILNDLNAKQNRSKIGYLKISNAGLLDICD